MSSHRWYSSTSLQLRALPPPGWVQWRMFVLHFPCSGNLWICNRRRGTELCLRSGYHSCSSLIIPEKMVCTIFTQSARVFPDRIASSNPITTFSVSRLQTIAAATELKVFPSPVSSATSDAGISATQTHLLTMNQIAQTWCTTNIVPVRPGMTYLWPGTLSSIDWRIGWAFRSLTASSQHLCSNSALILWRTVLNTELVLSGLRTSLPSTYSWTSRAPWLVIFSSSIIAFSCLKVSLADGLILRRSWNSPRC